MRIEILFYGSAVLCALSFALFALQVIIHVMRTPAATEPAEGLDAAQQQAFNLQETIKQLSNLAQAFSKAGPMATSGALCALFGLIALLSSGVVKIEG
jgi:hypothetical protein